MRKNIFINNLFFIVVGISLSILSLNSWIYLLFFIVYSIFVIYKFRKYMLFVYIFVLIILLIIVHYYILDYKYHSLLEEGEIHSIVKIVDKDANKYYVKYENYKLLAYIESEENFNIGDYVYLVGKIQEVSDNRIWNFFNYKDYLKYQKINGIVYVSDVKFIKEGFHINKIKEFVFNYVNKYIRDEDSNILIRALVLGDSSGFNDDLNEALSVNGIVHLFAVSGLHVSLFISFLLSVLKMCKVKEKYCDYIVSIFLFVYVIIASLSPSILRAALMFYLALVNKKFFKSSLSSLDICSLSFIILVLVNPFNAFNIGFILSYIVCFVLILSSDLIKCKNNYLQVLYMSVLSNVFTLPIIININYEINILSPLINVLFISLVSSIILPFSFVVIFIPILGFLYKYLVDVFLLLIRLCTKISINFSLPYFNDSEIICYYLIIIFLLLFFHNKSLRNMFICIFIIFIFGFSNKAYFYNKNSIDCLYLNDGEAMLIRNKNVNVLIDSGDGYDNEVYNYLKSIGIRKIDYFILTHNHNDHYGGAKKILDNMNVSNFIISSVNNSEFRNYSNVIVGKVGDVFCIKDIKIEIIYPYVFSLEENDNSLVTHISVGEYNILCLGDLTCDKEVEVISYLDQRNMKVDIIKIGHHGSDTSTSPNLLKYCKAKYAIIMTGVKWKNILPKDCIINLLNEYNIIVFSTMDYYSFKLYLDENQIYISSVH